MLQSSSHPEDGWSIQLKRRQEKLQYQVVHKRTFLSFHVCRSNWETKISIIDFVAITDAEGEKAKNNVETQEQVPSDDEPQGFW